VTHETIHIVREKMQLYS